MSELLLFLIKKYQRYLSFDHGFIGGIFPNTRFCRFTPSCSQYTYESIEKHGALRGLYYGSKRLFRCNIFSTPSMGTHDPVI